MYIQIFYTNVLKLLRSRNMTKKELADASGISTAYLTMITSSKTNPTLRIMEKIADALDVPLPFLLLNNDLPEALQTQLKTNIKEEKLLGYEYVSVLLPASFAWKVKKVAKETQKLLNEKEK